MINQNKKRKVSNLPNSERTEEDDRWNNDNDVSKRLYEQQAIYKIYRIPVFQPPPVFVIHLKHLDKSLKKELSSLTGETKNLVIREVVERIYEKVDRRFFLLSVKDCDLLHWRLEK
jgi:hypothetical protein